jgi:hypothetical protein
MGNATDEKGGWLRLDEAELKPRRKSIATTRHPVRDFQHRTTPFPPPTNSVFHPTTCENVKIKQHV